MILYYSLLARQVGTDFTLPYGTIVATKPVDASVIQIASPSVVKLSNGTILMSHDYVGTYNGNSFQTIGTTGVYKSTDGGDNWTFITDILGMFWGKLFTYNGDVYILGVSRQFGDVAIVRSTDNGETWGTPVNVIPDTDFGWATAPTSIIFKDGYLLTAMELASPPAGEFFAEYFDACLLYADLTDIMDSANWGYTPRLDYDQSQFPINIGSNADAVKYPPVGGQTVAKGWLEGNIVERPNGTLGIILRLEQTPNSNYGVMLDVNWDAVTPSNSSLGTTHTYFEMPGGNVKFTIVDDRSNSGKYWTVTTANRYRHYADNRVEAFLMSSSNLTSWTMHEKILGYEPTSDWENTIEVQGVQYSDIFIDGNDLLVATRTAPSVADGGTGEWHDASLTTFSRIVNFRNSPEQIFVDGSLIIDENSERLEDGNGIGIIKDQSKYFNSPFSLTAENATKVSWTTGLNFDGTNHLTVKHNEYLNPDNGLTVFAVVENIQATNGLRILSKPNGVTNDVSTSDWSFSPAGLTVGNTFGGISADLSINNSYIFAASFDADNEDIYNYLNGSNRGEPPSITGGSWTGTAIRKSSAYVSGNTSDLFVGKRPVGSGINFTSLVKAIHIIPRYFTPSEITTYTNNLNAVYSIF